MRLRLFTAVAAAAMLAVPAVASAATGAEQLSKLTEPGFYGLDRDGSLGPATVAPAGFYDFNGGTTLGEFSVAYVVPAGRSEAMPASVRGLATVKAIAKPGGGPSFGAGTWVILGPDNAVFVPPSEARMRAVAHASARDKYGCEDRNFCIYAGYNFTGYFVMLGPEYTGAGWQDLWRWNFWSGGFDNKATSMRNRRDYDSLLADGVGGRGTRYCADSHSADGSLNNNAIRQSTASSWANPRDDIHCANVT